MLKQLKRITVQMVAGANVATIAVMAFSGFSDRISPAEHPVLAQAGLGFPILLLVNLAFLIFWLSFSKRHAMLPIAGYLLCCVPIRNYFPVNLPADAPEGSVKVLSYNVLYFQPLDGWQDGRNPMMDYIAQSGADIVCLQEVCTVGRDKQVLDSVLGAVYAHSDMYVADKGECVRVFSKYPIVGSERIEYDSDTNLSAAFHVLIGSDTVTVINNHFESVGLSVDEKQRFKEMVKGDMDKAGMKAETRTLISRLADASRRRAPEAEAVAEYVERNKGRSIILCGDFNDSPISYTHRTVARQLTDCYVSTAIGPGISYHLSGFYVRIDNIMCSDDWTPYDCHVDNSIKSSDHYPIYCWLKKKKAG